MSGERYLLDTNAIIALLRGNRALLNRLKEAEWVGISILSHIEFLAFPNLSEEDIRYFGQLLERVDVVGLDRAQSQLIDRIVQVRQQHRLKLPDAIIAATTLQYSATLITEDQQLRSISGLTTFGCDLASQ
jgi:hypothetical protein